jgi:hypothetical protein
MARRLRIWQCAVELAAGLTTPRADVAASDRTFEALMRDSWLLSIVHAAAASGRGWWRHARSRTWSLRLGAAWAALTRTERVRVAGMLALVAGLTAEAAQAARPMPVGPLSWVLPIAIAALGFLASIAAGPLARAVADKTS